MRFLRFVSDFFQIFGFFYRFRQFLDFRIFFYGFSRFVLDIFLFFWTFLLFFGFELFLDFFGFFFGFFEFFLKLQRLLLKVTKVTTGHQRLPQIGQNSIKRFFFAQRKKKALIRRPKLSAGARSRPHSGQYLLVFNKNNNTRKLLVLKKHLNCH